MENKHFDELLYSLPDYITGELHDDKVKKQIEEKLLTDSSFREEHDSLKTTMNFIQKTELEPPSEVYFANLQANILSKVHKQNSSEKQSIFAKLVGYWKVAVPALTVCIVLFVYSQNMKTPQLPLNENKEQMSLNDKPGSKPQDTTPKDEVITKDNSEPGNTEIVTETIGTPKYKRQIINSYNENISAEDNSTYSDDAEGSLLFSREDDTQAQDEYDNLSTDDQLDILQSLKDKKL